MKIKTNTMMKKVNKSLLLILALTAGVFAGCKKDKVTSEGPKLLEYSLEVASNPNLQQKVVGSITGNDIYIRVPNTLDIANVIPSYVTNDARAIVYAADKVQESGVTAVNMSQSLQYRLVTSEGTTTYNLKALRNAAIISFGFYKEDNKSVLYEDYPATIEGLEVNVNLPSSVDVSNLVARFTTTSGAIVKVNSQVQESKVSKQNYNNPVTFAVTDTETTTPENFVVKVGRLAWSAVNTIALDHTVSALRLAIHPITNEPYIIYGIGATSATQEMDRKAVVAYLSGGEWKYVGTKSGFSGAKAELTSIAFNDNGDLYAAYKDAESGTEWNGKASIQKYVNGSWSYVGEKGVTPYTVDYLNIAIGKDGIPVIGYTVGGKNEAAPQRSCFTMQYTGSQWSGSALSQITTAYFSRTFRGNDGFVYYVAMDMTSGTTSRRPTLYKRVNNNWQLVGTSNVSPTETTYGAILVDAAVAKDGTAYLVFQSQATANKLSFVMKYDGNKWTQIGDGIQHTAASNPERDNVALAVSADGTLYFAYGDKNGVKVTTFDAESMNWNPEISLSTVNGDKLDLKISNDGIPYLATTIDSKVVIYKYDLQNK